MTDPVTDTQIAAYESQGTRVYQFAVDTLQAIVSAAFGQLVGLPAKQYVTSGQAVYDCEQVAVTVLSLTTGLPGATVPVIPVEMICVPSWSIVMELAIVRCGPAMNQRTGAVQATDLTASLLTTSQDAGVLMEAINTVLSARFGNVIASVTTSPPDGGMVATVARLTAAMP